MANRILRRNPIIAALVNNLLNVTLFDVDAVQRRLDFIRAQIVENSAIYADAAPRLAQGSRRLAEAMFAQLVASARHAPPESEEEEEEQQQKTPTLPAEEPDEEDMEELVAALAARFAQVASGVVQDVQEGREPEVWLEVEGTEVAAIADEYLAIAIRVEHCRRKQRALVQAHAFLLLVRAAAFAVTRARLLPGAAATYALAYAASGAPWCQGLRAC